MSAGASRQQEASASSRQSRWQLITRWVGVTLMLVGDILVVASLFSPWLEVFKIGDPDFPGTQEYGPWMALERGTFDDLTIAGAVFFAVAAVLAICTLILAVARAAGSRSTAAAIATGLALAGLVTVGLAAMFVPMILSLSYPYYDRTVGDGARLVLAGFLAVLIGAGIANILELRIGKQKGAQV